MEKGVDCETTRDVPLKANDPPSSSNKNQICDTALKKETQMAVDNSAESVKNAEKLVKTKLQIGKVQLKNTDKSNVTSTEVKMVRQQQSKSDGTRRRIRTITKPPVPCFRKSINKRKAVKATNVETNPLVKKKRKPPIPKFHGKNMVSKVAKPRVSLTKDCEGSLTSGAQKTRVQRKPPIPHFAKCRRRKVESSKKAVESNKKAKWCNLFQKQKGGSSKHNTNSEYKRKNWKRKAALPDFSSMRKRKRIKMQNESDMGKGSTVPSDGEKGIGKRAQCQDITNVVKPQRNVKRKQDTDNQSVEVTSVENNSFNKGRTLGINSTMEEKNISTLKKEKNVVDKGRTNDDTSSTKKKNSATSKSKQECEVKPWKRFKSPKARFARGVNGIVKKNTVAGNKGKFKGKVAHSQKKATISDMGVSIKGKDNPKAEGVNISKNISLNEIKKIGSEQPLTGGGMVKDIQQN